MWVIEEGTLECFKTINGEEKLVKTCVRGDLFGELALLYNCPRAASCVAKEHCKMWELDRETFTAICFEVAQHQGVAYEGFSAPGKEAATDQKASKPEDSEEEDDVDEADILPPASYLAKKGPRTSVSAEAYGAFNQRKAYEKKVIPKK